MLLLTVLGFKSVVDVAESSFVDTKTKENRNSPAHKIAVCTSLDSVLSKVTKSYLTITGYEELRIDCEPPAVMGDYLVELQSRTYGDKVSYRIVRIIEKTDLNSFLPGFPSAKKEKVHVS